MNLLNPINLIHSLGFFFFVVEECKLLQCQQGVHFKIEKIVISLEMYEFDKDLDSLLYL